MKPFGRSGSPRAHAYSESKQRGLKGKCLQHSEEAQPSSSAVGRKIPGEIAEDEAARGGRCGFSAYLSKLFQQEMKAPQIRC